MCHYVYLHTYSIYVYFFYFVIIETINAKCIACTRLGTQLVFYDLSQQAPEGISVPVLNGLNPNIHTYFEYSEGSSVVYSLHASSSWTNIVSGYSSCIYWAI